MSNPEEPNAAIARLLEHMGRRYLLLEVGLAEGIDDLSKRELQTLELIAFENANTVSRIAALGRVPMSTASWLANQLVEKQYLTRRPDINDRRVSKLVLAASGEEIISFLRGAFAAMAAEITAAATAEELQALVQLAERLTDRD